MAVPIVSSCTPGVVTRYLVGDHSAEVVLAGSNFTGSTSVDFGGNGVAVDSFVVDHDAQITAQITVSDTATLGERDIIVTNPSGPGWCSSGCTIAPYLPGSGTEDDPWVISTYDDLILIDQFAVQYLIDGYFIIDADIDAAGESFMPIGWSYGSYYSSFVGHLDGQDHTISNLTMTRTAEDDWEEFGLFSVIGDSSISNTSIKNLNLEDINFHINYGDYDPYYVGGLCSYVSYGDIDHVTVTGHIHVSGTVDGVCVGGIAAQIGWNAGTKLGDLTHCWVDVELVLEGPGYGSVGGIAEWIGQYEVSACFAIVDIDLNHIEDNSAGGLACYLNCPCGYPSTAFVYYCYALGTINNVHHTSGWAAGFTEVFYYTSSENCYAAVWLPRDCDPDYIDGFAPEIGDSGEEGQYHMTGCYWDEEVAGTDAVRDIEGECATPKTTAEMKTASTFSGWNPVLSWKIGSSCNSGYPCIVNVTPLCIVSSLEVETDAATEIAAHGATLNGNLTNMGGNASVEVYFEYGTTSGVYDHESTRQTVTETGAFHMEITHLVDNTTYYFRAVAEAP